MPISCRIVLSFGLVVILNQFGYVTAINASQDEDVIRFQRVSRLTTALESYRPIALDRSTHIEIFREDTVFGTYRADPEGEPLGQLIDAFSDGPDKFDLSMVAILRGPEGKTIEFIDASEDGSPNIDDVHVMAGDMVVFVFPVNMSRELQDR